MTPLRQRFLDDMRLQNLAPETLRAYVRAVARYARHFARSPDQLGREHLREYLLHLIRQKYAWDIVNLVRCRRWLGIATPEPPACMTAASGTSSETWSSGSPSERTFRKFGVLFRPHLAILRIADRPDESTPVGKATRATSRNTGGGQPSEFVRLTR